MQKCQSCRMRTWLAIAAVHLHPSAQFRAGAKASRAFHSTTKRGAEAATIRERRPRDGSYNAQRPGRPVSQRIAQVYAGLRQSRGRPPTSIASDTTPMNLVSKDTQLELKYLKDPLALAEHVRHHLDSGRNFEKALALVRLSSMSLSNIVSWNHLIDYKMKGGKVKQAFSLYNELKKRGMQPDSYTYMMLFRGLAHQPQVSNTLGRALSLYHAMTGPGSRVAPTIMHVNALLKVCARAEDLDSMWDIVARLPEKGPHAADQWTFTTLLNNLRARAMKSATGQTSDDHARQREEMVVEGRKIWAIVIKRWRSGDLKLDENIVCAMGRLLLSGARPRDWDDVLSLIHQTMNIKRLVPKLSDPKRYETLPRIRAPDTPSDMKNDASGVELLPGDTKPGSEFDPFTTPRASLTPNTNTSASKPSSSIWVHPGNNSLTMILEACLKLVAKSPAQNYWEIITSTDTYNVIPDLDNMHMYLRVLRFARASAETATFLESDFPAAKLQPVRKTFRIAMSTCQRDMKNPNALTNATRIFNLMREKLHEVDPKSVSLLLELAMNRAREFEAAKKTDSAREALQQAIKAAEPCVESVRNMLSFGRTEKRIPAEKADADSAAVPRDLRTDSVELMRTMIACFDKMLRLGSGGPVDKAWLKGAEEKKSKLAAYLARLDRQKF